MTIRAEIIGVDKLKVKLSRFGDVLENELLAGLTASALMVQESAVTSIQRGTKTGKIYKRGNVVHQASAPGQAPATDTGSLANSIAYDVNRQKLEARVGVDESKSASGGKGLVVNYAKALEYGNPRHKEQPSARPFMKPAYDKNLQKIKLRLIRAVDIAEKKVAK